jgi:hypothetical protein
MRNIRSLLGPALIFLTEQDGESNAVASKKRADEGSSSAGKYRNVTSFREEKVTP